MNAKRNIQCLLAAGIMAGAASARAEHSTSVIGLVNLTNYQAALLVITDSPPEASFAIATHKWVKEGDEYDDLYLKGKRLHTVISQIDFTNGVVRAAENNVSTFFVLQQTNSMGTNAGAGLHLDQADFDDAIDLYADLKGRTLLVHPDVKRSSLTLALDPHNQAEAVGLMAKALEGKGVSIIADGDKFEWVVPAGITNLVLPAAMPARLPAKGQSSTNVVTTLPAGSMNFINVDLQQVLDVYQVLTAQKWAQDKPLPAPVTISFHNQTPLTKNETLHAFAVLLRWHGLKVVDVDDKSFTLVPIASGE